MDNSTAKQPISDDQELAKALAGISQDVDSMATQTVGSPMPVQNAPMPVVSDHGMTVAPPAVDPSAYIADPVVPVTPVSQPIVQPEPVQPAQPVISPAVTPSDRSLSGVKEDAISELRPLIDKLDVAPEEKFDTYLLLIRSTDDQNLIAPAHEVAKSIPDEARRAQALLDIIKEIDFLSNPTQ